MIKEAIDRVLELSQIRTIEVFDRLYAVNQGRLDFIRAPDEHQPSRVNLYGLNSLVTYLSINPDGLDQDKIMVHVIGPDEVEVIGPLMPLSGNGRFTYARVSFDVPCFQFNRYMDLESFILGLQTGFAPSSDLSNIVLMLACLVNETIRQNQDDGFSQSLQIKTGLTTKAEVKVENPVALIPYRTFREVEQPPGKFILRLQNNGAAPPMVALFNADLAAWELEAMAAIEAWLKQQFETHAINVKVM